MRFCLHHLQNNFTCSYTVFFELMFQRESITLLFFLYLTLIGFDLFKKTSSALPQATYIFTNGTIRVLFLFPPFIGWCK